MKKIISFMIAGIMCFLVLFAGCTPKPAPPINVPRTPEGVNPLSRVAPQSEFVGRIIYARAGVQKEIFSVDPTGQNSIKIYSGECNMPNAKGNKVVFGNYKGIYTATSDARNLKFAIPGYRLEERPAISEGGNGLAFIGRSDNNLLSVYYMAFQDAAPVRLNIKDSVKYLDFLDSNTLIYSKKVMVNGKNMYQLFKYEISKNIETRVLTSYNNDIYPVASPDTTKIAFISYRNKKYALCVMSTQTARVKEINITDSILKDSIKWSSNNSDLLYITSANKMKISNVDKGFTKYIADAYIAGFSANSSSVIYANYDNVNSKQVIYRYKLGDNKNSKVFEFNENKKYPRSIKLLSWSNHIGL